MSKITQHRLPRDTASEIVSQDEKRCKKAIKNRNKADKKGKYIPVPGISPKLEVFISNRDLKSKSKTEKILNKVRCNYIQNRISDKNQPKQGYVVKDV